MSPAAKRTRPCRTWTVASPGLACFSRPLAFCERNDGLPQGALVTAVHGLGRPSAGRGLGELELFAGKGGEEGLVHGMPLSEGLAVAEELVVGVVAAVAATDLAEVRDELDADLHRHPVQHEGTVGASAGLYLTARGPAGSA